MHPVNSVAITGTGCLCAAGASVPEVMRRIYASERRYSWRCVNDARYPVFIISGDDALAGYAKIPETEKCGALAIAASEEAISRAGVDRGELSEKRVAVLMGTTSGSALNDEHFYREFRDGRMPELSTVRRFLKSNPSAMVARSFNLSGPCQTICNACSSGGVAVGEAASWIRSGVCDYAIAGGTDMLSNVIHSGFISLLITDAEPCRPFDRDRRGLNLGEGAGVLFMESEESAKRRGARVLALLKGYGNSGDAYHLSTPVPDGAGLERAIDSAMKEAGVSPDQVGFINAHGTGTPENDRMEGRLFSRRFPNIPFVSTKGYTGHALGAAGGIEAVITVHAMLERLAPANIGFENMDPEIGVSPLTEILGTDKRYAISNSSAFGGNNAALLFERGDL